MNVNAIMELIGLVAALAAVVCFLFGQRHRLSNIQQAFFGLLLVMVVANSFCDFVEQAAFGGVHDVIEDYLDILLLLSFGTFVFSFLAQFSVEGQLKADAHVVFARQLVVVFGALLLLNLAIGLLSFWKSHGTLLELEDDHGDTLTAVTELQSNTNIAIQEAFAYVVSGEAIEKEEFEHWAQLFAVEAQVYRTIRELDAPDQRNDLSHFEAIIALQKSLVAAASKMFVDYEMDGKVSSEAFHKFEGVVDAIDVWFGQLQESEKKTREASRAAAASMLKVAELELPMLAGVSVVLSVSLFRLLIWKFQRYTYEQQVAQQKREEAEERLREGERRLQQLILNCPAALYTCRASGDYGATFVSETIISQTGYKTREFIDDASFWSDHIHPDDCERVFTELSKLPEEGHVSCEYRFLHKNGTYRWMHDQSSFVPDSDGKPGEIVGFWKDISERKQAEEKLKQSEARLAEAERVGRIGHWDWNVVTNKSHLSDEFYRICGTEPSESGLTFDTLLDIVHPDDRENVRSGTASALDKHDRYTFEYRIVRPDGDERVIKSEARISRGQGGHPLRMFGVVQDITEQKQAEKALRASEQQLREMNASLERRVEERTAELTETNTELAAYAHSVSHDLRAPLRAIEGFASALLEDYGDQLDEYARQYAEHIVDSAQRLDALTSDLLAYSQLCRTEAKLGPVDLNSAVNDALSQLSPDIEACNGKVEVNERLPIVYGQRRVLVQIITNLLSNGMKFATAAACPEVRIWAEQPKDSMIRLWFEDNGIGIDETQHDRIFGVFERLHGVESYPGTGIGLALVARACERLGGRYGVESQLGKGSRFWVEFQECHPSPQRTVHDGHREPDAGHLTRRGIDRLPTR